MCMTIQKSMNFVLRTSGLARDPIARSGLSTNFVGQPIGPIYRVRVADASDQLSGSRQLTTACLIAGKSLSMAETNTVIIFDFDRTLIDDDSDRWVVENMGLTHLLNQLRPTFSLECSHGHCFSLTLISILLMPRKGFPLRDRLLSNPSLLKADCHEWSNGEELASILLQLVEKVCEE